MKRVALTIGITIAIVFLLAAIGSAAGYRDIPSTSPCSNCHTTAPTLRSTLETKHWGYTATSNKCKYCHAVHEAGVAGDGVDAYKLLRAATSSTDACAYCHVGAGAATHLVVYYDGMDYITPTGANNGHTISLSSVTVPDNSLSTSTTLVCNTCHSVHGANCIKFQWYGQATARKILRNDPLLSGSPIANSGSAYSYNSAKIREFCQKCHTSNVGSATHPFVVADTHAWSDSTYCASCHDATGQPHASVQGGYRMLTGRDAGATMDSNSLDDNCRRCHIDGTSVDGVGLSF